MQKLLAFLRKVRDAYHEVFSPEERSAAGFFIASVALAYAAIFYWPLTHPSALDLCLAFMGAGSLMVLRASRADEY